MYLFKAFLISLVGLTRSQYTVNEGNKGSDIFCLEMSSFLHRSYYPITELSQCRSTSLQCQEDVTLVKDQLQAIRRLLFYPPLVYDSKKYLISKFPHKNAVDAMAYCNAFGGYLAEIDDVNEYKALQIFVLNSTLNIVLIGGSDAEVEGTWIFPRTGLPVKFLDWVLYQPDNIKEEDCLSLWKEHEAKMNDITCEFRFVYDRFMCEIPNNF